MQETLPEGWGLIHIDISCRLYRLDLTLPELTSKGVYHSFFLSFGMGCPRFSLPWNRLIGLNPGLENQSKCAKLEKGDHCIRHVTAS